MNEVADEPGERFGSKLPDVSRPLVRSRSGEWARNAEQSIRVSRCSSAFRPPTGHGLWVARIATQRHSALPRSAPCCRWNTFATIGWAE